MSANLTHLFEQYFGAPPHKVFVMQAHASDRKIFRLSGSDAIFKQKGVNKNTVIGVENPNVKENAAFVYFSNAFKAQGLPVPTIYCQDSSNLCYIEEDLGDTTLFNIVQDLRADSADFPKELEQLYSKVISYLPQFQILAGKNLDYSNCILEQEFQPEAIRRDMEFFKNAFLSKVYPNYDLNLLTKDFEKLTGFLAKYPCEHFMYRDFQSRNVMIIEGNPWFIDYQGGRKGPLQYDVASMLYQASTQIPDEVRSRLIVNYLDIASQLTSINKDHFCEGLSGFVVVRMLQVLGTYGKQGLEQKKEYFLKSIPRAVNNLFNQAKNFELMTHLPELKRICYDLPNYVSQYAT
jgi:aminoglycoside/choline kinase family phosphotransferase